jgi:small conductance mechanosensitive channel
VAITYALLQFPLTVSYGEVIRRTTIRVALVWIGGYVADQVVATAIRQVVHWWATFAQPPGAQARSLLRVPTMSKALVGFSTSIIVVIAILATLAVLQVPIASVVTIGGIAAVAIGFAAQSLVRDCLGGLLVLFEDQYVEGDYVAIGDANGIVEHLTLRVVQVRDSRGNLITIPHSSAIQVVNSSRTWSRVDYRVTVAIGGDLRKAMDVVRDTLTSMRSDERWHDAIVEPVEWIGVESMSRNGVVLRALVRTAPLRQFEVRREINLRVYENLAKAEIQLGNDPSAPFVAAPDASPDPA